MSYLKDFRAELNELFDAQLPDAPVEARHIIINFAVDGAYQSYKNAVAEGKKPKAKPSARPRNPRPVART